MATRKKTTAMKKANGKAKSVVNVKKAFTKSELLNDISISTGLGRKDVNSVLAELAAVVQRHMTKTGPGSFTLPGLLKIKTKKQPARKARKGINPFTKEEVMFKARPARTVVKIQPLKALKSMVN